MIKKIGVIGAGTMGSGIAQAFVQKNFLVILIDREENLIQRGIERIKKYTPPELLNNINKYLRCSVNLEETQQCDLIIEAVFEEENIKKEVFTALNLICSKTAILATNTSSISINDLATIVDNPSRFIGMHFMNPPTVMKLIEVVKGDETSDETVNIVIDLAKFIDKIPALVNDSPGFVSNRLLFALIGEAMQLLDKGIANREDIDSVMKYGMNHPMGPIRLADFIGLDVCRDIMIYLYNNLKDERYKPTDMLEELVRKGKLGKKTGQGFYEYRADP